MAALNVTTWPLVVVAVVGTGLFGVTATQMGTKGAYSLMGIFGGAVMWAGGYALELATGALVAHYVRFLGAGIVPLSMLFLALQFSGRDDWAAPSNVPTVFAFPVVTFLAILTNGQHQLWARPETLGVPGVSPVSWGAMFYLGSGYMLLLSVVAAVLFAKQIRAQDADSIVNTASIFFVVTVSSFLTYSLFVAGVTAVDWTPYTFIVHGLLLMAAMFYL